MLRLKSTLYELGLLENRWVERNKDFGELRLSVSSHYRDNRIGVYVCMQMELNIANKLTPTLLLDSISVYSMETRFHGACSSLMDSVMEYALASDNIKQIKIANVFVDHTLYEMLRRRGAWVEHNPHGCDLSTNFLLDCK